MNMTFSFCRFEIIEPSIRRIVDRYEAHKGQYPFLDTKFDIVTGRDFDDTDEPFRRKDCIYSWIQGRGLESLGKHLLWFARQKDQTMVQRLQRMLKDVSANMEELRRKNGGHLPFAMRPDGSSFFPQESAAANYSDLFYAKGLFIAGKVLQDPVMADAGRELFLQVADAIDHDQFRTDQKSFDPKNQVEFKPAKFPQGPRMISLGGWADLIEAFPDETLYQDLAERSIRYILSHHVNLGQYPELEKFDFIETLDAEKQAWRDGDVLFCDPGHALEFTGLAAKCLCALQKIHKKQDLIAEAEHILPELFCHVFDYGFQPLPGGICKGFDLIRREPVNSDMPWWSLPETVRAGLLLVKLYPETAVRDEILQRAHDAFRAFCGGFLQTNGFGCQTRSADGKIINVIPAVSDADPGYHTNLSFLDVME